VTSLTHLTWLLFALPAAGAAILLLGGRRTDPWGHLLGCATALASFGVGVTLLVDMLGRHGDARTISQNLFSWVSVGNLHVDFGLQIDQLSICFVLLITGVGEPPPFSSPRPGVTLAMPLEPKARPTNSDGRQLVVCCGAWVQMWHF